MKDMLFATFMIAALAFALPVAAIFGVHSGFVLVEYVYQIPIPFSWN
jgi:hypothetical protein